MEELTPTVDHPHHPNWQKDAPEKMSTILQRRSSSKSRFKNRERDRMKKYEFIRKFDTVSSESGGLGGTSTRYNTSKPDEWIIVPDSDTKSHTLWSWMVQGVTKFFRF